MPVNHATADPSNLLDALRIIEHDVSDVTPPVPPIVLRNEHDMIEGYRMRMPEGVGYSTKSDTKIPTIKNVTSLAIAAARAIVRISLVRMPIPPIFE